jgi:hypothetical protein
MRIGFGRAIAITPDRSIVTESLVWSGRGNVHEARQTIFPNETSGDGKELLLALICWVAFDFAQINNRPFWCSPSRLCYLGHVPTYVFTFQQM